MLYIWKQGKREVCSGSRSAILINDKKRYTKLRIRNSSESNIEHRTKHEINSTLTTSVTRTTMIPATIETQTTTTSAPQEEHRQGGHQKQTCYKTNEKATDWTKLKTWNVNSKLYKTKGTTPTASWWIMMTHLLTTGMSTWHFDATTIDHSVHEHNHNCSVVPLVLYNLAIS